MNKESAINVKDLETAVMDAMCGRVVSISDSSALKSLLKDRLKVEKEKREADLFFERGTGMFAKRDYEELLRILAKQGASLPAAPQFTEAASPPPQASAL